MSRKIFYVYLHKHSHDGSVFYVGKGKNRRAWDVKCRGPEWKFVSNNGQHEVEIFKDEMSEECALTLEKILIAKYGVDNLVNKNRGGQGTMSSLISDATREKMRAAKVGIKRPKDACRNISIGLRNSTKNRGKKLTQSKAMLEWNAKKCLVFKASGNPAYDHTVYKLRHKTGSEFLGTMYQFRVKFNLDRKAVYRLKKGFQKNLKGWEIVK